LLIEWYILDSIIEFNDRLAKILRFSKLKLFKHKLGDIKWFIAKEFWSMMWQLIFVIDDIIVILYKFNYTINQAKNIDKQLI